MTVLTVGEIKTEIRAILGGRTDFDARLNQLLNVTQTRIARIKDFDELRALTSLTFPITGSAANDKVVSLSPLSRYRKIYSIRIFATNAMDRKLQRLNPTRWDRVIPKPEYYARGTPTHYMLWGKDQIELWRVPDIQYTAWVRYSRWPSAVGADGTFMDLENMDELIIHLCASYLALSVGHTKRSNELYRVYAQLAKDALDEEVEDFDTHMALEGQGSDLTTTRGYDDPFVRSIDTFQD